MTANNPKSGDKKDVLSREAVVFRIGELMRQNDPQFNINRAGDELSETDEQLRRERDRFKEIAKTALAALQTGMDLDGFVRGIYEDELATLQEEFLDVQ